MKNIYGQVNRSNNKEDRLSILSAYRRSLLRLLKEGYNPFENNKELFAKRKISPMPNNAPVRTVAVAPTTVYPTVDPS